MQTVLTIDINGKERVYKVPAGWSFINEVYTNAQEGDRYFSDTAHSWCVVQDPLAVPDDAPVIRKHRSVKSAEELDINPREQKFIEV